MWKWIMTGIIVALPVLATQDAWAGGGGKGRSIMTGGYCPAGMCSQGGGRYANDVKNCAPTNCRKGGTK